MKKVAILGSTGSIGQQTLDVLRHLDGFVVHSLAAYGNEKLLVAQAEEWKTRRTALISRDGAECLTELVQGADIAVVATRGIVALDAVLYCLQNGIDVALANKEVLVTAGSIVSAAAKTSSARLLPVDSEHSAVWQCADGKKIKKIYLTASGGPFFDKTAEQLAAVTPEEALRHPKWNMGRKITVDSATFMNKAFEVTEAHWLFDVPAENIEIAVHRQSVVHSLVELEDGSVLAQLACPDMRLPIQYALTYPDRKKSPVASLDLFECGALTFEKCDFSRFPCASLGHFALQAPPLTATVINAANDVAVDAFLAGKIDFCAIYATVQDALSRFTTHEPCDVRSIKATDRLVRTRLHSEIYGEEI